MARTYEERRVVVDSDEAPVADNGSAWTLARVIYAIAGLINAILLFRVVLSLLGANRNNVFADIIYSVSAPLVAPFRGLLSINTDIGVVRLELETLIAIAVYWLLAWFIVRIVEIATRTQITRD